MIDDYLNDRITLGRRGDPDAYGQHPYTNTTLRARVEQKLRLVRTPDGEQVRSELQVFVAAGTVAAQGDRVTYDARTCPIVLVDHQRGLDGVHQVVLHCGTEGA